MNNLWTYISNEKSHIRNGHILYGKLNLFCVETKLKTKYINSSFNIQLTDCACQVKHAATNFYFAKLFITQSISKEDSFCRNN